MSSRLSDIKARAEAATEGPWEWTQYRVPTLEGWKGDPATYRWQTEVLEADHNGECGCRSACQLDLTVGPPDADFIAHARTDVPALVAAVEAVLELHRPERHHFYKVDVCTHCAPLCHSNSGMNCDAPDGVWPCPTVIAVRKALGEE